MTTTTESPRARFVSRQWRSVAAAAGDRPIAIYGAGRHTRWLLEQVRSLDGGPQISVIIDDEPRSRESIAGVEVRRPAEADPSSVGVVVISSESIESHLAQRASLWAERSPAPSRPVIIRLYDRLPPGPYDASHDEMFTRLADAPDDALSEADVGDFAVVKKIAAARARIHGAPLPVPPVGVRSGYDGDGYLKSGEKVARTILDSVARHSAAATPPRDILDWGCSSGRVLRHFVDLVPGSRCWGCDIDPWTINWAAGHLSPPLSFFRSTTVPSLPLESASFDLIYAISIFTHLSDNFDTWLMELRRVLRPGGFLFATINDEHVWQRFGDEPTNPSALRCPRLDFSRPLEDDFVTHGLGPHAQSFWHSRGVRRRWSFAFDVLEITPRAVDRGQTAVVLRRPVA